MMIKRLLLVLLVSFLLTNVFATTYYYNFTAYGAVGLLTASHWNTARDNSGTPAGNFNTSGDVFVIQSGSVVSLSGSMTLGAGVKLQIESTASLTESATLNINSTGIFQIDNGATYIHSQTNLNDFAGTEIFGPTSNVKVTKWPAATPITSGISLPYGNLEIALTSSVTTWNQAWSTSFTLCAGSLTLTDLGSGFFCVQAGTANVTIGGNFSLALGTLDLSNGAGTCNFQVAGNFTQTGGIITASTGDGGFVFNGNGLQSFTRTAGTIAAKPINFTVSFASILDFTGTSVIDGTTGNFVMFIGSGLRMGLSPGITLAGTNTGHVQNTGIRTFTTKGYYTYKGTSGAQVSGTGLPSVVNGLTINNASGLSFTNAAGTTVNDSITFTSGRIKTDATHSLILGDTCTISSAANQYGDVNEGIAASYVSGPLKWSKKSTTEITLPIGKDTTTGSFFAPVKITPSAATSQTFTAEYFPVKHFDYVNVEAGTIDHVSELEHWNISSDLAGSTALIGLSWRPTSKVAITGATSSDSARAWDSLVVAHYLNKPPYLWSRDGAPLTANDLIRAGSTLNYGYITSRNPDAVYSSFTLGSRSSIKILPVKLIDWYGIAQTHQNILKWITKEETEVKSYDVQRSSDGVNFTTISTVYSLNIFSEHTYSVRDANPLAGNNYYHLLIRDVRGKVIYSRVINLVVAGTQLIHVFPDPADDVITFIHKPFAYSKYYSIFSITGKKLLTGLVPAGSVSTTVDISHLPAGQLLLVVGNQKPDSGTLFMKR